MRKITTKKQKAVCVALCLILFALAAVLIFALRDKPQNSDAGELTAGTSALEATEAEETAAVSGTESLPSLPDSVLYYGEIKEIKLNQQGQAESLVMDSQRYGPYVMNLSEETVFVDSGKHEALDPGSLKEGDRVYVFHSPVTARSMPPQSAAFAVLSNIPMDTSCGQYHEVEEISKEDGVYSILTSNGELTVTVDQDTKVNTYSGEEADLASVQPGDHVIAWYQGEGTVHGNDLMLLP